MPRCDGVLSLISTIHSTVMDVLHAVSQVSLHLKVRKNSNKVIRIKIKNCKLPSLTKPFWNVWRSHARLYFNEKNTISIKNPKLSLSFWQQPELTLHSDKCDSLITGCYQLEIDMSKNVPQYCPTNEMAIFTHPRIQSKELMFEAYCYILKTKIHLNRSPKML